MYILYTTVTKFECTRNDFDFGQKGANGLKNDLFENSKEKCKLSINFAIVV